MAKAQREKVEVSRAERDRQLELPEGRGGGRVKSQKGGGDAGKLTSLRTPPSGLRTDSAPLTLAEKRAFLARVIRIDLLDCLDDSGAFDPPAPAKSLPAASCSSSSWMKSSIK